MRLLLLAVCRALLAALFAVPITEAAETPAYWRTDSGSLLVLEERSGEVTIRFVEASPGLTGIGVAPGTALFHGRRTGNQIAGTAIRFYRNKCRVDVPAQVVLHEGDKRMIIRGDEPASVDPGTCRSLGLNSAGWSSTAVRVDAPPRAPAAQPALKGGQPVRAFQQNTVASAPAFADGFMAYAYQKHKGTIIRAYEDAVRALSAELPYLWTYPEKYVGTFYRSVYVPGDACRIRTLVSHNQGLGGHYLLIARPSPSPFTDCTKSPPRGAFTRARPSTADGSSHSRYLFDLVAVTASSRDGAIDDTVSPDLTTACDLVCRGGGNCIQGPHMARFANGEIRVSHGLTSRTTYVGSKTATSQFCSSIVNLQAALEASHVKYESSLKLDTANRGACPDASYSNYPWFGKGEAARYATRQQIPIPGVACLEGARMDNSFPYQGMTRAELTLTLRYPVGRWASCFTDTPLRAAAECKEHAVPVGGLRTMRAVILF